MGKKQQIKPAKAPARASRSSGKTRSSAGLLTRNRVLSVANAHLRERSQEFKNIARDLTNLLSSTDIALLFADKDLRVRGFTPTLRELFRLTHQNLGMPVQELERYFEDPSLFGDMALAMQSRHARESEVMSRSGRVYMRVALPYRTERQRVDGVVVTFVEITRRKLAETALRTSEERHRMILDSVAEYAILLLDLEGRFVNWTSSAERIFGYTTEDVIGQPLSIVHTPEERARRLFEQELALAREQKSVTVERWHVRKNGSRFWGTGVLSSLYDEAGRLYGYVKVVRDNTDRKMAMEALRQAKIDAELANSAKDFFLANVSHELRTPLSAMLLWAKLLRAQKDVEPQQLHEALDAIVKSAEEQQALIEDLMDTSRIATGKLRLEMDEVDLVALAEKVLAVTRPAAEGKNLRLESELDPATGTVHADGLRLQQILVNLLNNAVKFTPEGGQIRLTLRRLGEMVEAQVTDTGQGISPEFIGRIFDRFTQADSAAVRVNGGLGLGLSIARQLVELHGGSISAFSEGLAKGTTFTVRMPLPPITAKKPKVEAKPVELPSLEGLRVLLVEDMAHTRNALTAVLTEAKAVVVAAENAADALEWFGQSRPNLLLSDIGLGRISGHELIAQIRQWEKNRKTPPVPAVALTAYADERNRKLALQSGFQGVLTKPVDPIELIRTLARLADRS